MSIREVWNAPSWIEPPNVVVPVWLTVNVPDVPVAPPLLVIVPAVPPLKPPTMGPSPDKSSVPPLIVTVPLPRAPGSPICNEPLVMMVPPV